MVYENDIETYVEKTKEENEISLIDILLIIIKNRKTIGLITLGSIVISIMVALSTPEVYHSEFTFMSDSKSSSSGLASLADNPLAAMAGISKSGEIDYTVILKSRGFREEVIKNNGLYDIFIKNKKIDLKKENKKKPTIYDVAKWLDKLVSISKDTKSGVYKIEVDYKESDIAAKIAKMYYERLEIYLKEKTLTKSKRNRKYLEKQIEIVSGKLKEQENQLKTLEKKYKTVSITDEAKAMGEMISKLKTNILELSAQLKIAGDFAGEENLEYRKTKKELETYSNQLTSIEKGDTTGPVNLIPIKDIPDIKANMQRLQREVEATISVYKILVTQYESAKLEEVKDEALITPLDVAIPADIPDKPNKKLIIIIGTMFGLFAGIYAAFIKEFISKTDWSKLKTIKYK